MSRSVRTRRLTVYDAQSAGVSPTSPSGSNIPVRTTSNQPTRSHQQSYHLASSGQQQQRHQPPQQQQQQQPAEDVTRSRRGSKGGTSVGINLKKRLSLRYGDVQRLGPGTDTMIPSVPSIPSNLTQQAYVQSSYDQLVEGSAGVGVSRRAVPIYGDEFDSRDESGRRPSGYQQEPNERLVTPRDGGSQVRGGQLQVESPLTHRRGSEDPDQQNLALAAANIKGTPSSSSSSSRQPTLAWEGSSLKTILDSTRRYSSSDNLISLEKLRQQDDFSPTDYLRLHLPPNISPANFSETLTATKTAVREDIKSQVFANYSDFIAISSQVGALENEMIELKSLLAEWRGMPRVLESQEESSKSLLGSSSINTLARRSSLLSLQQVYRAQLTALWEGIDNAQKFIPYKPGRHLVAEAPDFIELNAATYRPTHNVALFLLDDLLLVASRKKGRVTTQVRLEAQRCFPLGEIVVVDLKDSAMKGGTPDSATTSVSGTVKDSIKIKRGKETFVYRAERSESKKALLNAFRRVAEELINRKKKQGMGANGMDGRGEGGEAAGSALGRRASVYSGMATAAGKSGANNGGNKSLLGDLAEEGGEEDGVMKLANEKVKEERKDPHRWLNDWSDGLAVDIALRRWKEACEKVSKGKAVLSTYTPSDAIHQVLTSRLDTHVGTLVSALLTALQSSSLRKSLLITISSALNSLGYSSIARQTFLNAREDLLRKRKRSIKFEGDTELYVAELSMVVFGMVRNTSEWFMVSWKETGMASGFVRWALKQIHSFALTFRRQVYGNVILGGLGTGNIGAGSGSGPGYDKTTAIRARAVALESAQQLKDVGLDFGFALEELLRSEEEQMAVHGVRLNTLPVDDESGALVSSKETGSQDSPSSVSSGRSPMSASSRQSTERNAEAGAPTGEGEKYTAPPPVNRRRAVDLSASATTGSSSSPAARRVGSLRQGSSLTLPTPSTTATGGGGGGGGGGGMAMSTMAIPSLTLTLADEASGISHRISSADLPNVTAQEIRRNSVMMSSGGAGGDGRGAGAGGESSVGKVGVGRVGALDSVKE